MFSHGVMTALMFAMVGAVYDQAHTRDMTVFGGLAKKMPRHSAFFVDRRAVVGGASRPLRLRRRVPYLRRHLPGRLLWAGALGIVAAAITAIYIFRLLALSFFGPLNEKAGAA